MIDADSDNAVRLLTYKCFVVRSQSFSVNISFYVRRLGVRHFDDYLDFEAHTKSRITNDVPSYKCHSVT